MVRVFMETGLRLAELVALRRKDLAIGERKGKAEVREGKGRKPRTIPLSQEMNVRRAGVDWPVIAKLMGHTSVVTTMQHYGTPSERDLRAAVDPDGDD